MEVTEYQHLLHMLRPPADMERLDRYLSAAATALGVRSNAELARVMNVSPSTVANWKRRGGMSADHSGWFMNNFVPKVFAYNREMPRVGPVARAVGAFALSRIVGENERITDEFSQSISMKVPGIFSMSGFLLDVWQAPSGVSLAEAVTTLGPVVAAAALFEV